MKKVTSKFKCLTCSMRFNRRNKGRCPQCYSTKIRDDRADFKVAGECLKRLINGS